MITFAAIAAVLLTGIISCAFSAWLVREVARRTPGIGDWLAERKHGV